MPSSERERKWPEQVALDVAILGVDGMDADQSARVADAGGR
jgi:hypothetical protein